METLVVKVADMAAANFIKRVLQEFRLVQEVKIADGGYISNAIADDPEMAEDIIAYQQVKSGPQEYISFEEALDELKKSGKL